jgi:hypothetical protein
MGLQKIKPKKIVDCPILLVQSKVSCVRRTLFNMNESGSNVSFVKAYHFDEMPCKKDCKAFA